MQAYETFGSEKSFQYIPARLAIFFAELSIASFLDILFPGHAWTKQTDSNFVIVKCKVHKFSISLWTSLTLDWIEIIT